MTDQEFRDLIDALAPAIRKLHENAIALVAALEARVAQLEERATEASHAG